MADFTLELIAYGDAYTSAETLDLSLANHVHKRVERFIYTDDVKPESVPIAFIENPPLDSWGNVKFSNRTYTIPVNSPRMLDVRRGVVKVEATNYTTPFSEIIATNKTYINEKGKEVPLFFRHKLPNNVVQCELKIVESGNKKDVDTGYVFDSNSSVIYTNYHNFFNPDTGAYKLFFIVWTDQDGNTSQDLLNPEPAAKEADWEDIDLDTGRLIAGRPLFSRERSGSGYTFRFNQSDTWWVKPVTKSLIQPLAPSGKTPDSPWYMRFTAGEFSALVNGSVRRYSVPEFDQQPFAPYKPVRYSPYSKMLRVNNSILSATKTNLNIDPEAGLHLNLFIYDFEGVLIRALTTNGSLHNTRFADTNIFWEYGLIQSWDNQSGIVAVGIKLHASWSFQAQYYYDSSVYEYTLLNMNPLSNRRVLGKNYVFYIVPDVDFEDRSIHYLELDSAGKILYCSQGLGFAHPNLQLLNSDGSYNANTVVGLKYQSEIESDTFMSRYGVGFENTNGYSILAEVVTVDNSIKEYQEDIDVRRPGAVLSSNSFSEVVRRNPQLLHSVYGYGEEGMPTAENAVMVIDAPLTLLQEYGGDLLEEQAEKMLRTYMPGAGFAVIRWVGTTSELSGYSTVAAQADLTWTWEGSSFDYRLYKRDSPVGEWSLIHTEVSPPEGTISYTDTSVISGETYYYEVRVVEGTNEFPADYSLSVRVA